MLKVLKRHRHLIVRLTITIIFFLMLFCVAWDMLTPISFHFLKEKQINLIEIAIIIFGVILAFRDRYFPQK